MLENKLKDAIRDVPDFPKPGIVFKDIMPVLENPNLSQEMLTYLADQLKEQKVDAIAGVESRGFLYGMALAMHLGVPFVAIRKKGKLPYDTVSQAYDLEYGQAEVEMHVDSIQPGWNVWIHDDLLATGGTAEAAAELIKKQKGHVGGFLFLIELAFLNGREKLRSHADQIIRLVAY